MSKKHQKDLKPPNLVLSKPIPVRDARFVSALSLLLGRFFLFFFLGGELGILGFFRVYEVYERYKKG